MENPKQYDKLYKCPVCSGKGKGNRMVDHILSDTCDGTLTRKLREAERDGKYAGRDAEAELNTQLLFKEVALEELKQSYYDMKKAIENDILEIKELNEDFLPQAYAQYFAHIY